MASDDTLDRLYREYNKLQDNPDTTLGQLHEKQMEIDERLDVCRNWERQMSELEQDMTGQDYDDFFGIEP